VSDFKNDKAARAPRPSIEQGSPAVDDVVEAAATDANLTHDDIDEAMGLIKGTGIAIWRYAVRHPNTTFGAVAGFVLAVLVLTLGLWDTIVIAFFVFIGALIGQIRDGENGIVNFFARLFNNR